MQLELHRKDYLLVGLTSKNCLKLLPPSETSLTQKIAIGDQDGVLQLFSLKKDSIQISFKSLPGPPILSLQLGGAIGAATDRIFIVFKNEVRGYTKKGKVFLSFSTNLTEDIVSLYVYGSDLIVCGNHTYNHYRECKDLGSYLCGDKILDVVALSPDKGSRLMSILACEGRMLRILEHCRVIHSVEIDSSPVVLRLYDQNHNQVFYGTLNGHVGILQIGRTQINNRWLLTGKTSLSAVSCLETFDITGDGNKELILARENGNIEIYTFEIDELDQEATLIFTFSCNESITSLQGGYIANQSYREILATTYTGRVFSLTTELLDKNSGDSSIQAYVFSQESQHRISKLKTEIRELEERLEKEREKYQISTNTLAVGLSAIPTFAIKDSLTLRQDASYVLTIEVQTSIDNILLQSDVKLHLVDTENNSAVVSYSACGTADDNQLLVTYRCQVNTNRIEVQIIVQEGNSGTLNAYITPMIQPKCCQLRTYQIKPLCLHRRIYQIDDTRPFNVLNINGTFSLAEMHTWIYNCFPEVPEKHFNEDVTTLYFTSTFLNTVIQCVYKKGEAELKCENISAISIIKDFMSKEATKKKIHLSFSYKLNNESIRYVLSLLHPKLQEQYELTQQHKILMALEELNIYDTETIENLHPSYRNVAANEKTIRKQYALQHSLLEQYQNTVLNLFVDQYKFLGVSVKPQMARIMEIVKNYNFENLVAFFYPKNEHQSDDNAGASEIDETIIEV